MNDIAVQQGMFRVSSIRAAGGEEEGFLVLVADCSSKYPYTMDITSDQGPAEVDPSGCSGTDKTVTILLSGFTQLRAAGEPST